MKVEVVYPEYIQENLQSIDNQIMEIHREYYEMMTNCTQEELARHYEYSMKCDPRLRSLQMCKSAILCQAVPKLIVTTESEEEREELLRRYGNEMHK